MKKIYDILPIYMQNAACSSVGAKLNFSRYNGNFKSILKGYKDRSSWDYQSILDFRNERLKSFIKHAFNNTDYYSSLFSSLRIHPEDIRTEEDFASLPILTKDEVRKNYHKFIAKNITKSEVVMAHTSGTTGSGLVFPTTKSAVHEQWAVWWRYRALHNITRGTWCGYFGGRPIVPIKQKRPPYWRINWPSKQVMYSAYHISDATIDHYISDLRERGLRWLHGYPSIISIIAARIIERNIRHLVDVDVVTTGAENLSKHQYSLIKEAFGVAPRQHYGLAEAVANFSEDKNGIFSIDEDFSFVEFSEPLEWGARKIIGTNFTNLAFPLLRYDVGDQADLHISDGRRIVTNIDGRSEDYLVLSSGAKVGRLDHILKDAVNVVESQFVQSEPGYAQLKIVPSEGFSISDEKLIRHQIEVFLGKEITVDIVRVSKIAKTRAGKLRFVVSDL